MSQCLRGLQKTDSMLLLCFAFLQQSLAKSGKWILVSASCPSAGSFSRHLNPCIADSNAKYPLLISLCSWQKHEGPGGPTNHFVRALLKVALRVALKLVFRVRAQRPLFIPMFGVPATFGLLWKACGDPVARLWDNRTETTEMGFLSHRNKLPVLMWECTDKAIPRAALKGIQVGT